MVFNIGFSGNFHFNNIVLQGGLTSDDVLFNFYGGNSATLSGGPTMDINANFSGPGGTLYGVFLDPFGTISVNNTVIDGRVFGGDSHNEQIVSGAEINAPMSVPDGGPTVALLGLAVTGVAGLGGKFRK